MIAGSNIETLVELFQRRHVLLYHACQYIDLVSYVKAAGVPSRACLARKGLPFTAFETDTTDQDNAVWDKAFLNLSDFGRTFANGGSGVPNPYGPILLKLQPAALLESADIAVCLCSAGAAGFDRERDALKSVAEIGQVFQNPESDGYPRSTYVKFRDELSKQFSVPRAADPEISCSVPTGRFSLSRVSSVLVDPYVIRGRQLCTWVRETFQQMGISLPIYVRASRCRGPLYSEIAEWITGLDGDTPDLAVLAQTGGTSAELKDWANEIYARNLDWQFRRYATYLQAGTLEKLPSSN